MYRKKMQKVVVVSVFVSVYNKENSISSIQKKEMHYELTISPETFACIRATTHSLNTNNRSGEGLF